MTGYAKPSVDLKVLVVSNSELFRRGIVQFLNTLDISLRAGEASFESVVSDIIGDLHWDLIALDFEAGGDLGILKHIREVQPRARMLVLNADNTSSHVKAAFAAGASGYLVKSSSVEAWHDAFEIVAAGGRYPPDNAASTDLSSL